MVHIHNKFPSFTSYSDFLRQSLSYHAASAQVSPSLTLLRLPCVRIQYHMPDLLDVTKHLLAL